VVNLDWLIQGELNLKIHILDKQKADGVYSLINWKIGMEEY
jgi:hypothetical protein